MRVVISGATGFIGNALGAAHDLRGDYPTGIATRSGVLGPMQLDGLDIRDSRAVDACIAQASPDIIYHCAALSTLKDPRDLRNIEEMIQTNVIGTLNMLMAARRSGVKAFVFVSSDKQYGTQASLPVQDTSDDTFANGGLYEMTKAWGDQLARLLAGVSDDMSIRVARLVNVHGPRDLNFSRIIPGTIKRCIDGTPARITAGPAGAALREYIHISDVTKALLALADDALASSRPADLEATPSGMLVPVAYNIGSPHRHTAADIVSMVRHAVTETLGVETPEPDIAASPAGAFEPRDQTTDTARLCKLLGEWEPLSVTESLPATISWYASALAD
jgi:nucleoside-diphosphate-sugar epimerase